ncbi:MAG TPA: hypothetical protein VNM14_20335 [Planctomycetota bacterium]|nr:hypothetical protein [Planctomycetota bacterium]
MMLRWAGLFLAFIPLQDPELPRLAEQLGHDDSAQRQRAERRLLELGETARATLERLADGEDPEVRTRARSILASLDRAAVRRKWLGPAWTVRLPEGEVLLGDLPGLLKNQLPVPVEIPVRLAGSRVRIGGKDVPAWEFLDQLCRAHGGLRLPLERPEGAFALEEGKPGRSPTCYSGPFRVSIERITLEEREDWRGGRMVLNITWQPNVHPLNRDYLRGSYDFKITEFRDEKGDLLNQKIDREPRGGGFTLDRTRERVWRSAVSIAFPPAGLRRFGRIKGSVTMVFPSLVETVEFKKPMDGSKAVTAGDTTIRLLSCRRTEQGVVAGISFSRPEGPRIANGRGLELRSRFNSDTLRLRGADGTVVSFDQRSGSHASGSGEETAEFLGFFPLSSDAEALTFPFVVDSFEQEVPFEFTDVDLP